MIFRLRSLSLVTMLFSQATLLVIAYPVSGLSQESSQDSDVCSFNRPAPYQANNREFKESPAARERRLASASQQGWVEDFGGALNKTQASASEAFLWGKECPGGSGVATREETFSLHCSGAEGGGYNFANVKAIDDLLNIPTQHMDQLQEELIFLTAAQNIDELGQCQQGLFKDYFNPSAPHRSEMLQRAFSEFERIRPKVQEQLEKRASAEKTRASGQQFKACIKDSCLSNTSGAVDSTRMAESNKQAEEIDQKISILLSGIPMGNRQEMKKALVHLYRTNPKANMNQFSAIFDTKMRELQKQADATVKTMDGIRTIDSNGMKHYCVDSNLKKQFYRSGQVELVLQGYKAPDVTAPLNCRLGPRYGVGGEVLTELALVPTYFTGYGMARLALRAGSLGVRGARLGKAINVGSRAALLGIEAADAALFAKSTAEACFSSDFMTGMQGRTCNAENEMAQAMHEAEIGQCVSNIMFFGLSNVAARAFAGIKPKEVVEAAPENVIVVRAKPENAQEVVKNVDTTPTSSVLAGIDLPQVDKAVVIIMRQKPQYKNILLKVDSNKRIGTATALKVLEDGSGPKNAAQTYLRYEDTFKMIRSRSPATDRTSEAYLATFIVKQKKAGVSDDAIKKKIDDAFEGCK